MPQFEIEPTGQPSVMVRARADLDAVTAYCGGAVFKDALATRFARWPELRPPAWTAGSGGGSKAAEGI